MQKAFYDPKQVSDLCATAGYNNFAASFPVPAMINGHQTDRYFMYPNSVGKLRSRPLVWMELDGSSGAVLRMNNCYVADFVNSEVYSFDKLIDYTLPDTTVPAQLSRIRRLHALYNDVKIVAFQKQLTNEQKNAVMEYVRLLEDAVPSELMPFYYELGSSFFAWINAEK